MIAIENIILDFIRNVYATFQWPGVVILMAIESAMIPLPSELVMPLSGWMLIKEKGLGPSYVFLAGFCGALGNLIGSLVAYWAGAQGGRPLLEKYGKYLLVSGHDLDIADRWFNRHGTAAVFFGRLLPVIRTFISFPAGVARMSLWKFSVFTFAGAFPWCLGLAYGGYQLGIHWERLRAVMRPFDIPIIFLILVLLALYIRRHIKHRNAPTQA